MEKSPPTIQDLYPSLSPEEIKTAEETFARYLMLVLRIAERLESNPQPTPLTQIDSTLSCTTPDSEVS